MDEQSEPRDQPLFYEPGASWSWLWAGPAAALAMAFVQYRAGLGFRPFVPMLFLVMVSGFLALQIKAGRIHTSVELTAGTLREGAEELPTEEILQVYPDPENTVQAAGFMDKWQGRIGLTSSGPLEKWQTARTLGEISGVPRGRTAVGVKLTGGRYAQAWAKDHEGLRAALTALIEARDA
ncbi:MAG: DUF3093 domain-containing protein [Mycobacterium sp.]